MKREHVGILGTRFSGCGGAGLTVEPDDSVPLACT